MKRAKDIIKDYKDLRKKHPDPWLRDCRNSKSLDNAIHMAATARDIRNHKHPHQYRIPNQTLSDFKDQILLRKTQISKVKEFDKLHDIVNGCRIEGIGDLTVYDTTHRIGKYLIISPDKVYMHSGTKVGARKYLNQRRILSPHFKKTAFSSFSKLSCEEIEDVLCIYKDDLGKSKCERVERIKVICA